jgi:hypothetical protein
MSLNYAAGMASSQTDTLIAGSVALASIGGVLMGVGASEDSGTRHNVWTNPLFATGCALVACGVVIILWILSLMIPRARRRRSSRETTIREHIEQSTPFPRGLGRGLGALLSDPPLPTPSQPNPLQLKLVDEDWRLVGEKVWVAGLKVRIVNIADESIELTRYYLYSSDIKVDDTGAEFPEGITDSMWDTIGKTQQQLKREHTGETFTKDVAISPLTPLTTWYFGIAAVPLPERGRPWCKLRIKDSLGNAHELIIPARPAKTYLS